MIPLQRRIRLAVAVVTPGLVVSGLSAIPIPEQFALARRGVGADFAAGGAMPAFVQAWLTEAARGIQAADEAAPFIWYGTDWLAFGHLVIALAFVGAWRDPVRYRGCSTSGCLRARPSFRGRWGSARGGSKRRLDSAGGSQVSNFGVGRAASATASATAEDEDA